jgi:hypothetical protein
MFRRVLLGMGMLCILQPLSVQVTHADAADINSATAPTTHTVPAGGNLQAAINAAQPGDTIALAAGATYVGNFVLPAKTGTAYITIRTALPNHAAPAEGVRISPRDATVLAKLRSPNTAPALATAPGAHHYRILLLEFMANAGGGGNIINLGDGSVRQNSLAQVPYELILDRVYVHGDPALGQKRGIALNSASTSIINSYISDIKAVGQDSQAICGWNGPGPYVIANNYLEAAGENVLFGGADPAIPQLVPSDITVIGNHLSKPLSWRGSQWQVKNLFELKSARRVRVDRNLFENNWLAAQAGYAILLKSVNQDGGAPWSVVERVEFTNNIVRHVSSAINILGRDTRYAALELNNVTFRNNLFTDVSGLRYGGVGRLLLINGGSTVKFLHNTAITDGGTTVYADGETVSGFEFADNVMFDRGYAIKGGGTAAGNSTIARYFPGAHIAGNIIAGGNAATYPVANHYPPIAGIGFVDPSTGDYRLSSSSPFARAASDGSDPGCDFDAFDSPAPKTAPPPSTVQPPPSAPTRPTPQPPGVPQDVTAKVIGSTVTITWNAPPDGHEWTYLLEAGMSPGAANAAVVGTGPVRSLVATAVPAGVYYVRVRAANALGFGPPSSDIAVAVGGATACEGAPQPPSGLHASVERVTAVLGWSAPGEGCTPTYYVLLAGSTAGLSDLAQAAVGGQSLVASASPGTYYVRVVAVNAFGASAPSNEIVVTLQP